jgi:hypothetical protein
MEMLGLIVVPLAAVLIVIGVTGWADRVWPVSGVYDRAYDEGYADGGYDTCKRVEHYNDAVFERLRGENIC